MQAIIMAAGKGSRIAGITDDLPKSFLSINGKKIIEYQLEILQQFGIKDIIIVVGYNHKLFQREFASKGIKFVLNPFYHVTNVLSSFWFGQKYLIDDFLYFHADTIFHSKIFERLLNCEGEIVLPVEFKKCKEEDMKVIVAGKQVIKINKTMEVSHADGEFIGIAKIKADVIPELKNVTENIILEGGHNLFFESAIQKMIDSKNAIVRPLDISDLPWNEIDFPEDYEKAKRLFE